MQAGTVSPSGPVKEMRTNPRMQCLKIHSWLIVHAPFTRTARRSVPAFACFETSSFKVDRQRSKLDLEEISHHLAVNFAFEGWQPVEIEFLRQYPSVGTEFAWALVHIDLRRIGFQTAEEIRLLLAVTAVFADFFPAGMHRVKIAVTFPAFHQFIMSREKPYLFTHFAEERLLGSLPKIHPALRKLPRPG